MHMKGISALYVAESRPTVLPSSRLMSWRIQNGALTIQRRGSGD
jgi:hypothetical protein